MNDFLAGCLALIFGALFILASLILYVGACALILALAVAPFVLAYKFLVWIF